MVQGCKAASPRACLAYSVRLPAMSLITSPRACLSYVCQPCVTLHALSALTECLVSWPTPSLPERRCGGKLADPVLLRVLTGVYIRLARWARRAPTLDSRSVSVRHVPFHTHLTHSVKGLHPATRHLDENRRDDECYCNSCSWS